MSKVLTELVALLALERIEENLFRGQSQDLGWGAVFGGQVLGQALSAAEQTVPADRACHSLHAYFMRSGDASRPIVYEVDRIRDGHSFTTRRVRAVQGGKAIFSLSSSFHLTEPGFHHQDPMPQAPDPESLRSDVELARMVADMLPAGLRERATADRAIDIRPVSPTNPMAPEVRPPHKQVWFRANGPLADDPKLHRYLLAYASDFHFLVTSLLPHGVSWLTPGMQVASLDHAMWFHRPFRMDQWLLHQIDSPSAGGARGLVRGRVFDQSGQLVVSTMQEGLIRDRRGD
ncbi:MAG: acyl-CoA thioesterase II [Oligoflexia bacterium]|nr:acyl-CoA thioesterase II [Oligoflexia bacterium]